MTIDFKVLDTHAYALTLNSGSTQSGIGQALDSALLGILDGGTYTNGVANAVTPLDAGYLDDIAPVMVSASSGTGSLVPIDGDTQVFKLDASVIDVSISFGGNAWTIEYDYIRTSSTDWLQAKSSSTDTTTGYPNLQLDRNGNVQISISGNVYVASFGTVSIDVPHRYTAMLKANILYTFIDGIAIWQNSVSPLPTPWDPASIAANIALSNGNYTMSTTTGWTNVKATRGISTGTAYWEIRIDVTGSVMVGIFDNSATWVNSTNFGFVGSWGAYLNSNGVYNGIVGTTNNYPSATDSPVVGTIIMFALNMDTGCLFMGVNGSWINGYVPNGASTTGAVVTGLPIGGGHEMRPALSVCPIGATIRGKSSTCSYALPTGYRYLEVTPRSQGTYIPSSLSLSTLSIGSSTASTNTVPAISRPNSYPAAASIIYSAGDTRVWNNLTVWNNFISTKGVLPGEKRYWEIYLNEQSSFMLGLALDGMSVTRNFGSTASKGTLGLYLNANSWYNDMAGVTTVNPSSLSPASYLATGNWYGFALDMVNHVLFVSINGSWLNGANPSSTSLTGAMALSLPNETLYPAVSLHYSGATFVGLAASFRGTKPAGYSDLSSTFASSYSSGKLKNLRFTKASRYDISDRASDFASYPTGPELDPYWYSTAGLASMENVSDIVGDTTFYMIRATANDRTVNNLDSGGLDSTVDKWKLWDGLAGANAKCYRALSLDGTYKYVVVDLNTVGYILTKVYEGWDATTHVGTNLAFNSDAIGWSQQTSVGSTLNVFTTTRWLALWSTAGTTSGGSSLSGCLEISRDDEAEPVGVYPRFAWFNQGGLYGAQMPTTSTPYGSSLVGQQYYGFSLPRTVNGATGSGGASSQMVGTVANRITSTYSTYSVTCVQGGGGSYQYSYQAWSGYYYYTVYYTVYPGYYPQITVPAWSRLLKDVLPTGVNSWNADNNNHVFSAYAVDANPSYYHVRGRFQGLKLLANNVGSSMDTINIKQDTNGLYSSTGTSVNHAVIRLASGGCVAIPLTS